MLRFGAVAIPATHIFLRSALSVAFVNISPVLPGHVLVRSNAHTVHVLTLATTPQVAPQRAVERLSGLTAEEAADLMLVSQRVGKIVERYFGATCMGESRGGLVTLSCSSLDAGDARRQGVCVFHVHMHVIPRRKGDVAGDQIYQEVEKWNHNVAERPRRSTHEMDQEAAELTVADVEQTVLERAVQLLTEHFGALNVDAGHGVEHALIVLGNCTRAMWEGGAASWPPTRRLAVMLAALLHDADDRKLVPDSDGSQRHARRIAEQALGPHWRDQAQVADVAALVVRMIGLVAASKNKGNDSGVEEWMLYPRFSDRLEAVGAVGIVRCYTYNRSVNAPLFLPSTPRVTNEEELAKVAPLERFLAYKGDSASMIDHFYDKLVHCCNLGTSNPFFQREAEERRQVMLRFLFEYGRSGTLDESRIRIGALH